MVGVEFNFIPVDFAADAIVKIAVHTESIGSHGHTYHINNFSHPTSFDSLLDGVRLFVTSTSKHDDDPAAQELAAMTYLAWRKKIESSDESNPLFVVRSMFHSWFPNTSLVSCTNTWTALQALAEKSVTARLTACPRVNPDTVARWLSRLHAKGLMFGRVY
jgi:hypothetical protein